MRIIILYVSLGIAALCVTFGAHLLKAELKGYEACDWWERLMPALIDTYNSKELVLLCLCIVAVWPMCVVILCKRLPEFYDEYMIKLNRRTGVSK